MSTVIISKSQSSLSGDAVLTTDYVQDTIVKGKGFVFEKNFAIATGATLYILYDYTTYKKTPDNLGIIYVLPPLFSSSSGLVKVNTYRETNYSGGTVFYAYNANTTNTKTVASTTFSYGATGTEKGIKVFDYIIGGEAQGNNSANGAIQGISFFIRNVTQKTLLEVINESGKDITFHNGLVLFEI